MKAVQIKEYVKEVSQLRITEVEKPKTSKKDQVIIKVIAAAANFFDILQVKGQYQTQPPFPWIAGLEFAGVVTESTSDKYLIGDRVFGSVQGVYCEYIRVDVKHGGLIKIPKNLTFEQAATLFITAPTSYLAIFDRGQVKKGEYVLVHAAAGGVGLMALQMAKSIGAIVIATASSAEKLNICKKYGADHLVNYKTQNWVEEVKKITGKLGVDVVFDPVGLVDLSLKVVGWNSRILVIGFAAGTIEKVAMNKALLKSCSIVGVFWGGNVKNRPESVARIWESILQMVARNELIPVVFEKAYNGIEQVPEALIALGNRETYGKVVIKIAPEPSKL